MLPSPSKSASSISSCQEIAHTRLAWASMAETAIGQNVIRLWHSSKKELFHPWAQCLLQIRFPYGFWSKGYLSASSKCLTLTFVSSEESLSPRVCITCSSSATMRFNFQFHKICQPCLLNFNFNPAGKSRIKNDQSIQNAHFLFISFKRSLAKDICKIFYL